MQLFHFLLQQKLALLMTFQNVFQYLCFNYKVQLIELSFVSKIFPARFLQRFHWIWVVNTEILFQVV